MIMVEQLRSVNKDELIDYIGHIDGDYISKQVNDAIRKNFWYPVLQQKKHN